MSAHLKSEEHKKMQGIKSKLYADDEPASAKYVKKGGKKVD